VSMKLTTTIKIEEAAMLAASIVVFSETAYVWWIYPLWFLAPDLSMLGYIISNKIGAVAYNIFHHKGIAIILLIVGHLASLQFATLAGSILLGHSSFDRILGYGLKYYDSFHHTHLGMIGKEK